MTLFRKHYSKYGLESRLHFRIHSGIEALKELNSKASHKENTPKHKEDTTKHKEDIANVEGISVREERTDSLNDSDDEFFDVGEDFTHKESPILLEKEIGSVSPAKTNYSNEKAKTAQHKGISEMVKTTTESNIPAEAVSLETDKTNAKIGEYKNIQSNTISVDCDNISEASSNISPVRMRCGSPAVSKETSL